MIIEKGFKKAKEYIDTRSSLTEKQIIKLRPGPCITISRAVGAGSDLLAEELLKFFAKHDKLPWTVFDKNLIEKVLEDHNLSQKFFEYFSEETRSDAQNFISELFNLKPSSASLVNVMSETILHLGNAGRVIIIGRASNMITAKLKNSFHVRLTANLEDRIKHVQQHYSFTRIKAMEFIKKEEIQRKNYLKKYFHKNIDDPLLYHLVINASALKPEESAKIIGELVMDRYPEMFK